MHRKRTVLWLALWVRLLSGTAAWAQLPVDAAGWTVFTASEDTRIYYVDDLVGDDATAAFVESAAVADPFHPTVPLRPYRTISAAASAVRDGYPDWILLRRGGVWQDESLGNFKSGRSGEEPLLIGYYGASGPRPHLKIVSNFIDHNGRARSHLALLGLYLDNYKQDPRSDEFDPAQPERTLRLVGSGENILIEDCKLEFCEIVTQGYEGVYRNFKLRRSIVVDTYYNDSTHNNSRRPSGIYASETHGLLVEDCVFDHNGWNEDVAGAGANMYNHNLYLSSSNSGMVVRNNIITRGAAHGLQLRACGLAEDNLFVLNAVALNLGYHGNDSAYDRHAIARDNVILDGRQMDPENLAGALSTAAIWGIWTSRHRFLVENNVIADRRDEGTYSAFPDDHDAVTDYVSNTVYQWDPRVDVMNPAWIEPGRDVASYHATLGQEPTFESFLEVVRNRPLGTWDDAYSAHAVNAYVREGYSVAGNTDPTVAFSIAGAEPLTVPSTLSFTSVASDPDGDDLEYAWSIEDMTIYPDGTVRPAPMVFDTHAETAHTFTYPGTYEARLTVYDGRGGSATRTETFTITGNHPPIAQLSVDALAGEAPLRVSFDASASVDEDRDRLLFTFDFGDGTTVTTRDPTVSHVFAPGDHVVTLTIDDGQASNHTDTLATSISVSDPTLNLTDYYAEADAPIDATSPDSNFGSVSSYRIYESGDVLIRVDYSANAYSILNASLYLESKFGGPSKTLGAAYLADDSWDEHTVTWNSAPDAGPEIAQAPGAANHSQSVFDVTAPALAESDERLSFRIYEITPGWQEFRTLESGAHFVFLRLITAIPTTNTSPVASLQTSVVHAGDPHLVAFDASASSDADGHALSYTWDFGDGSAPATGTTVQHAYLQPGNYLATLIIDDGQGANQGSFATASASILVSETSAPWAGRVEVADAVTLSVPSLVGCTYLLQRSGTLADDSWQTLETRAGTGAEISFTLEELNGADGFFRLVTVYP